MSDTILVPLLAALSAIGGGLAASVPTLWYQHRRWKLETKLAHLQNERRHKDELYRKTLKSFQQGIADGEYPHDMIADILVLMPKSVGERFKAWMSDKDKDAEKASFALMDFSMEFKKSLAEIDRQIDDLLS